MAKQTKKATKSVAKKGGIIEELNSNPTEANWKRAVPKILKEGTYYYVFYPKELKGKMSLFDAHVVIYAKDHKILYKVPIMRKTSKGIEGATIYLKGLEINRKMIGR